MKYNRTIQDLYIYCKELTLINPSEDSHIIDSTQFIQQTISNHVHSYQKITRDKDKNGNPYSSIICYCYDGTIFIIMSTRQSSPNCAKLVKNKYAELYIESMPELPNFHLSASEYNSTIDIAKEQNNLYYMN